MPSNPNRGSFSSSKSPGPVLLASENVDATNVYGYTSWINLDGMSAWNAFIENIGGVAVANIEVQGNSLPDGTGLTSSVVVANGPAPGTVWWVDNFRYNTSRTQVTVMPQSIRFGFNTAGPAGALRFDIIGIGSR